MGLTNNNNKKDNKPFPNQIDTIGPLIAEIYKIVQRIEKKQEEFSKIFSRIKNDY